ncbi:hypothetical protein FA95DRAFT_1611998 [Auriscalpium vulgare]|uniref:Uncharacterized protein n=1 Tax=Auriscalpium vulgare TaxID=40419 RepID=A0ACB8R995_9AGAM|nr:hypothetical protein FA95DRAFT_1611998 [Auriscalpium vulgare]
MLPPEPPGDDPPSAQAAPDMAPERMIVDSEDTEPIVDTALEPPVTPLPIVGSTDSGHSVPNPMTSAEIDRLLTKGDDYWMLHALLRIPVHSRACAVCTAFLNHQDPLHPSWAHVQEQFRIHQRSQFDSGVACGLALSAGRIATSEDVLRRAEENVHRLTQQRNVARQSEAAAQEKIVNLQAQLETIRLEHAALVLDHANATQALDRALSQPPTCPPSAASLSLGSQRRLSPKPANRKRRRTSPTPTSASTRRPGPTSECSSRTATPSWTSSHWGNIHGSQWARWVPITHEDVSMAFARATTDEHAAARIRALALSASDLAVADRTPVMRFMVQQWGTCCNTLMATHAPSSTPPIPAPVTNGGGPDASSSDRNSRNSRHRPERTSRENKPELPNEWTTVAHGKHRAVTSTDDAPSHSPAAAQAPGPPRQPAPEYNHPIEEWLEYYRNNPSRCPRAYLCIRAGDRWVAPQYGARPFEGNTRNLSLEDVARHFANHGYHPRSLSITELEEYAAGRRNIIEGRPLLSTAEWESSPTLAEMGTLYPPTHATAPSAGPHRNLYPNMSLDLRPANGATRAQTPEGPPLPPHAGSLSPDFPSHYVPPTPQFVPLTSEAAGPLPVEAASWADDLYAQVIKITIPYNTGGKGKGKASRTIDAQFRRAVPHWASLEAEPLSLDAGQREAILATDIDLNDILHDDPAPPPPARSGSSAPRLQAQRSSSTLRAKTGNFGAAAAASVPVASTSGSKGGKGATAAQTSDDRRGGPSRAGPQEQPRKATSSWQPAAMRVIEVSDGSDGEAAPPRHTEAGKQLAGPSSTARGPHTADPSDTHPTNDAPEHGHGEQLVHGAQGNSGTTSDRAGVVTRPLLPRGSRDEWPASTKVVPPEKGRRMAMGAQTLEVAAVLRRTCAKEVPTFICFRNAFPSDGPRSVLIVEGLKNAARELEHNDILARLKQQPAYHELLLKIPEARMSIFRGDVKKLAMMAVRRAYHLKRIPAEKYTKCMKRVLMEGRNGRLYVFPGDIAVSHPPPSCVLDRTDHVPLHATLHDFPTMTFDTGRPFCHPAIVDLLHDSFFASGAPHRFPKTDYIAVSPRRDTPVIPPVMVAFIATTGLSRMAPGAATKVDFNGDTFKAVYQEHLRHLKTLKDTNEDGFWGLLSWLYKHASKGTTDPGENLDDLEEGDDDDNNNDNAVDADSFAANFAM